MRRWAILLGLSTACGGAGEGGGGFRPLAAGDPAPAYSAATLAGDSVSLAGLQGKAVMLNVWATWCVPCREEMPALQRTQAAWADSGLAVVAVSVDAAGADRDIETFLSQNQIAFTVAKDPAQRITRTFKTIGVPETFLIARSGKIVKRWIGQFDPESAETAGLIRQALDG